MGKISINQDSLKSRREWKRHKIQDGNNVYRILPPFGDVSVHNNYPYRKWSTVWLADPKTGRRRPFATPLTDGEECPVKEYNDSLTKFIEGKKKELEAKGLSEEKVKTKLKGLHEVQWKTRPQHTYVYNAADKSGEVGILELKSTAHQGVKKVMSQYIKEYGQDPTSLNSADDDSGLWINITKSGDGKNTKYDAQYQQLSYKDKTTGKLIKEDDRSPLSDNIVQNYSDLGYDLNTVYLKKDYAELRDILLFNLAVLAEDVPECVLDGYDVSDIDTSVLKEDDSSDDGDDDEEEVPVKSKPSKSVALNLGSDDEDDMPAPVKKSAKTGSKRTEDFMAMADDILGD